ncbi:MAG TPA: SUMF1/EgtB/PvdO family nonheme iron enzyme [Solirubrobacteraceae bacterium]|jgi:iron(II)-dependent oxidoreductase|nr:SUMF1/EgtB/PvdO family nonheme iron enzyme [Solirubrobacteraceae bacterium]
MARIASQPTAAPTAAHVETLARILAALDEARRGTHRLVAHLADSQLEQPHSPIMSPLAWDLAHIAAYEDLWLAHRHAGLPLLRPELAELYDAFETPRARRTEVPLLNAPDARRYMEEVRGRAVAALAEVGVGDGTLAELVVRHELQHNETMRQTLALANLLPPEEPTLRPLPGEEGWLTLAAGAFTMGAGPDGFAYDNERPRHLARTGAFQIARRPVTNASWLHFSEGGGYERREWWSDEGWAWKQEYDITHHPAVAAARAATRAGGRADTLDAPVCHVSWFEADAFARAHRARLPTEAEWERAATSDQGLEGVGQVWEWTSSHFHGYPGFVAHPYREYSEVFFGDDYLVLRGGSWATHPRVASLTFRNWDYPLRRQIFAGVRLARDVA